MTRWHAELYIGKSKTPDAIYSSTGKANALQGIFPYIMTMVGEDENYKIVVKSIKV